MLTMAGRKRSDKAPTPFGAWLLNRMDQRGMNQNTFAAEIGTARQTINSWLYVQVPRAPVCFDIARALDVSIEEVVIATRLNDDAQA